MSNSDPTLSNEPIIDIKPANFLRNFKLAAQDIIQGTLKWRLNWTLGFTDLKIRYKGSVLGPLWITIIMACKIATISVLYAYLLKIDLPTYLPYISISIVIWTYMNCLMFESCSLFAPFSNLILSIRLPYSVYVWRTVYANILSLLHHMIVFIVVFLIFRISPYKLYLLIPAIAIWLANSFSIALLLAILGTRFKDTASVVASVMQALFFITPVIWKADQIHFNQNYLLLDPIYPLLDIIRAPLLGGSISPSIWAAALGYSLCLWIVTLVVFAKTRFRIAYWI